VGDSVKRCKHKNKLWESMAGMLTVYCMVNGKKVYRWRCADCGTEGEMRK